MLVLTREIQKSVIVGEANGPQHLLNVTILAVHVNQVHLGFEVSSDASTQRSEARERIRYSTDRVKAHTSSRSGFNSWLNGRARGAGKVETLNPWDMEVATYV